jgi:hypothetical protein
VEIEGMRIQFSGPRFDTIVVKVKVKDRVVLNHNADVPLSTALFVTFDLKKMRGQNSRLE